MHTYKIGIVEDETVYADMLAGLIKNCCPEEKAETSCFKSGEELLESAWQNEEYAVFFIDIELPGRNGMETARLLRENGYQEMIVFTTNYEQFVYEGYEVEAFRYLLKPVKQSDVAVCMERVKQNMQKRALGFSYNRKRYQIAYKEIVYISSYGHYLTVHTLDQSYEWKYLLKDLQGTLPEQFVRCHRSFIVNMDYVRKLDGKRILLKSGEEIDVAGGYLEEVRKAMSRSV